MSIYRLTPDAEADLIDIRRFTVAQWGGGQSNKYFAQLRQTLILLAKTPALGKPRLDVGANVQSFPYVSHVIYYTFYTQQMVVFAVLHKRMLPASHLDGREVI